MGRRARKKEETKGLLLNRDPGAFDAWMEKERNPDKILQSLLYDSDPLVRWRTIEAFGDVAVYYAAHDLEKVRLMIRNLLWLMNDESGGLVWNAPEAIGLILYRLPNLISEYGKILAGFIHEEPFERGTHFALSKIVPLDPPVFMHMIKDLTEALDDRDEYIRGLAANTLAALKPDVLHGHPILKDDSALSIYEIKTGNFYETTVSALAGTPENLVANG